MGKLASLLSRVGLNGFLLGIFLAIGLAALVPELGSQQSSFPWKPFIQVGIALLFFLYGLKLDPAQLREGLSNWKLHLLVQSATFLIFPLVVMGILGFSSGLNPEFALGVSYLSALPSTVSASVVLVALAGGNVAAAIFNASISSLLGVFLTPVWLRVVAGGAAGELDVWSSFGELSLQVLFPVVLGIGLHAWLFPKLQPYFSKLKYIDQSVILIIVFTTFAESFSQQLFSSFSWGSLGLLSGLMGCLLLLALGLLYGLSSLLGFSRGDQITTLFCGSTKSLVHGVAMGKVLFPNAAVLGLVLLPVMVYHLQQLIVGSILARYFEKKNNP
jgi:solute carrier family 10 (sodium/bile acid cotransporter), member 7